MEILTFYFVFPIFLFFFSLIVCQKTELWVKIYSSFYTFQSVVGFWQFNFILSLCEWNHKLNCGETCRRSTLIEGGKDIVSGKVRLPERNCFSGKICFMMRERWHFCLYNYWSIMINSLNSTAVINLWKGSCLGWSDSTHREGWVFLSRNDHSSSTLLHSQPEKGARTTNLL